MCISSVINTSHKFWFILIQGTKVTHKWPWPQLHITLDHCSLCFNSAFFSYIVSNVNLESVWKEVTAAYFNALNKNLPRTMTTYFKISMNVWDHSIPTAQIRELKGRLDQIWKLCRFFETSKSKIFPVHSIQAYRRGRYIAPFILNLDARWGWAVDFMHQRLHRRRKGTPVTLGVSMIQWVLWCSNTAGLGTGWLPVGLDVGQNP